MTTTTILPNSSSVEASGIFLSEPSRTNTSLYLNLDDSSTLDYIWVEGIESQDTLHLGFQNPSIPSGSYVTNIVVYYNSGNRAGDTDSTIYLFINDTIVDRRVSSNGYNTEYTKTLATDPATGLAWNGTSLNEITSDVTLYSSRWYSEIVLSYIYIVITYVAGSTRRNCSQFLNF